VPDVLIVGAGPAGSAAAIHLARAGRGVLLVDRCRFPRLKPCGEYYNPECSRLLRELGVMPRLLAAGARPVPALVLGIPGGRGLQVPFEGIAPPGDPALSLGRETLDTVLVEAAREAGASVWEETLVREPLVEGERVIGAVVDRNGQEMEVRARIVLAADGLRSRFARRLGLGQGDGGRRKIGITARYQAAPGTEERVEMHAGGPGCCGLVVRGEEANLGMVADGRQAREIGGDPARFFRQSLAGFPDLGACVHGEPLSVRTVGPLTWMTRRQAREGCMLLGDAAGFYDPFTGQGVTFALLTAELAAETALDALAAGVVSDARLAEYGRRRRALLDPRVQVQKAIQAVVDRPRLLDHVLRRLDRQPDLARTLIGVIADVLPARRVLSLLFLTRLFL
jgi:menaquinone-9 beta-reductase